MGLAVAPHQHLGRLGKAVVVLGTHAAAVGPASVHDANVANGGRSELPLAQALGLPGQGGHEISALAAMSYDDDALGIGPDVVRLAGARQDGDGMDGTIQGRAEDVGHAGIELEEGMSPLPGGHDLVLDGAHEGTGVGHEVRAGFDLEAELPAGLLGKVLKDLGDRGANLLQVGGGLARIAAHLVPPSEVAGRDGVPDLAEGEGLGGHLLPDGGIAARADVGVDALDYQAVLFHHFDDGTVGDELVPDAKAGGGSADVGLGESRRGGGEPAGPDAGVDPDADDLSLPGVVPPDALDLRQRAGVDLDAQVDQFGKVPGQLLGGEGDVLGGDARRHGPADLVAARRIDVDALGVEVGQDGPVGAGLHGVPDREAVRVGEGQALVGELLQLGEAVGVQGRTDRVDGGLGRLGGEERRGGGNGGSLLQSGHGEGRIAGSSRRRNDGRGGERRGRRGEKDAGGGSNRELHFGIVCW